MNRFKSDSVNASCPDEVEFSTPEDMADEELDSLLQSHDNEPKNRKIKHFDIDRAASPGGKVGSLRPLTQLFACCNCCACKRNIKAWCKRVALIMAFLLASFLIIYQQDIRLYFGFRVYSPYPVSNTTIHVHSECEFAHIRPSSTLSLELDYVPAPQLPCFDDQISSTDQFPLSRSWDILPANSCINTSQLNSNVCIESSSSEGQGITCLPSFMIVGFEKASTTELLLWLSYHPNLLGRWAETRFFSKISSRADLETKWRGYMSNIPPIPDGKRGIGQYWSYEKTPSYILNTNVAKNLRSIMPNIRLIVMVRNPAKRAYSAFAMYTQMVDYYSMKDTWNLAHLRYNSLVMRNLKTGVVKFAITGGEGGSMVPRSHLPHGDQSSDQLAHIDQWKYVSFPPNPQDFHDFLLHDRNFSYAEGGPQFNYRQRRILLEGHYAKFIKAWQTQFPSQHFLVIPMERLWNKNTMGNLNTLQRKMGIPVFDYKKVTTFDSEMKRFELKSASTFFLDKLFNTGDKILPMLPESKKLLDTEYCASNRELKKLVGGSYLKGYSCTGD